VQGRGPVVQQGAAWLEAPQELTALLRRRSAAEMVSRAVPDLEPQVSLTAELRKVRELAPRGRWTAPVLVEWERAPRTDQTAAVSALSRAPGAAAPPPVAQPLHPAAVLALVRPPEPTKAALGAKAQPLGKRQAESRLVAQGWLGAREPPQRGDKVGHRSGRPG